MNEQGPQNLLTWKRIWLILIMIAAVWLIVSARAALVPIVVAFILAYLLNPIVEFLESKKLPRTFAILIILLAVGLLLFLLWISIAPIVKLQAIALAQSFPDYVRVVGGWIESALTYFQIAPPDEAKKFISERLAALGQLPVQLFKTGGTFLLRGAGGIFSLLIGLAYLALIPILTFYTLRDFDQFGETFFQFIHPDYRREVGLRLGRLNQMLGSFIRGQLIVGFFLTDVPFWLLLGLLAGLASIFPYVEWIVALPITIAFTAIDHQDWIHPLKALIVFAIISPAAGMLIIPRVIGGRVGLHPVVVIASILMGGELMGFVGILLAVPLAAAIKVGIEAIQDYYLG